MPLAFSSARYVPLLSYEKVISALGEELLNTIHEDTYNPIAGVSMDSRDLFLGEMFLALDGGKHRGIDFIATAYSQGVRVFTLAEKYHANLKDLPDEVYKQSCFLLVTNPVVAYQLLAGYYLSKMGGLRIAVTGSAGKTTTKEMMARLLGQTYQVFCSLKNENNHLGVPKNIFFLQRKLTGRDEVSIIIFELGMNHAREIDLLASIVKPHLAVITNILYAHIGNFSCREDIALAKGEVIPHLVGHEALPDYPGGALLILDNIFGKNLILNQIERAYKAPNSYTPAFIEVETTLSTSSYFYQNNNSITLVSKWLDALTGSEARIPGFSIFLGETLSLIFKVGEILKINRKKGFFYLTKSLAQNETEKSYLPFSSSFSSVKGRLHLIHQKGKPLIIDDTYNANPTSMIKTITALIRLLPQAPSQIRLRVIIGDMLELGQFSQALHETCGKKIGGLVKELSLEDQERIDFFLLGKEMKACYDNIHFPFKKYYDRFSLPTSDLLEDLYQNCDMDTVIFFKASHGMKFDQLLNSFLNSFPNPLIP